MRLGDVAHVIDSVEDDKQFSKIYGGEYGKEGTKGVNLAVMRQPGSNTIEVTDNIKRLLPVFQAQMPPTVHLGIRGDRSKNIREAFQDIQFTMAATLALVIMVIFLFLRNFSATMIPAMALPFSIVGTFAVMYLLDFSLNNISMMALILSIGFVVDDAIVMLENIVRHIENGETPMQAALTGSKEIGFTIVSMTLSLAAVFIPDPVHGRHSGPAVPRIRRHHLHRHSDLRHGLDHPDAHAVQPFPARPAKQTAHGFFYRAMEGVFDCTLHVYARHAALGAASPPRDAGDCSWPCCGVTGYLYMIVPKGFIPDTDNDNFSVNDRSRAGHLVLPDGQVSGTGLVHRGAGSRRRELLLLHRRQHVRTERRHRPHDDQPEAAAAAQSYRRGHRQSHCGPSSPAFPGLRVSLTVPAGHPRRRTHVEERLRFHAVRPGYADSSTTEAPKLERIIARLPGLQEVTSDLQIKTPRVNIVLDRDRAAALNLNWNTISSTLYDAFGPQLASTIYAPTNQYRVLLEMLPQYQQHTDGLDMIYLKSDDRQHGPAGRRRQTGGRRRPAEHPALRPAAFGDHFLRAEARRLAGRGDR